MRALLVCLALTAACTRSNESICCASRADCSSIGLDDAVRTCSGGLVCVDHACTAPQCELDGDCGGATPYCAADQVCVGCVTSDQCAGTTPTCDEVTRACRGCVEDADCASTVCDFDTGACVGETGVVYASPTGPDTGNCDKTVPCSISRAFAVANVARSHIKLAPGIYTATVLVKGKRLWVHGFDATLSTSTGVTVTVHDDGQLHVFGLTIVNTGTGIAVLCESDLGVDTPVLQLDRLAIDAQQRPIHVNLCTAKISRSTVFTAPGNAASPSLFVANNGVVSIDRTLVRGGSGFGAFGVARLDITNSVIADLTVDGVVAVGGGAVSISFSTIVNSIVNCGSGSASCAGARNGMCIDNSIIWNSVTSAPADTVSGTACSVSYSLVSPQSTTLPGANNKLGMNPLFKAPANGDYHLQASSPAVDAADPNLVGTHDLDGTTRPQGPRSDLGAFELKP